MGYSLHIPLPRGTLKVKSESRLRPRERSGNVPTFQLFSTYFVWQQNASQSGNKAIEEGRITSCRRSEGHRNIIAIAASHRIHAVSRRMQRLVQYNRATGTLGNFFRKYLATAIPLNLFVIGTIICSPEEYITNECFMKSTRSKDPSDNFLRKRTKYGNRANTRFGNAIPDASILTPISSANQPCRA